MRIPTGWLLLCAAVILIVVSGAYMFGYLRGEGRAQASYENEWLDTEAAAWRIPPPEDEPIVVNPPMARPAPAQASEETRQPEPEPRAAPPETAITTADPTAAFVVEPNSPTADPREAGLNYFVLIHTTRANAIKLATFWRDHGLDAFAIKPPNLNLYKVVVLPGHRGGERNAEDVKALERHIKDVSQKWRLQVNPRDDLGYYLEKYNP
ncbi:MAG: hypothetical protein ACYS0D_06650 [Planctomycetota bacterium]|jgi:hypothetical protein